MKTYTKINGEIIIEQINKRDRTIISVICNNEKTILSDVKTYSHFWNKVIFNDTYIVAYSRGCFVNPIPLKTSPINEPHNVHTIEHKTISFIKHLAFKIFYFKTHLYFA